MIKWAIVLHFYQPPTQDKTVTRAVFEQCYNPLVELLLTQPRARVTINVSGSLVQEEFVSKLAPLVQNGQVEVVLSASTHPLLPLTSERVGSELFDKHRYELGLIFPNLASQGVYPPELAVSPETVEQISAHGNYILVDESSVNPDFDFKKITRPGYVWKERKLLSSSRIVTEIVRSYPTELSADKFVQYLKNTADPDQYLVSVNDAELFGHHYRERLYFLQQLFERSDIEFLTCFEMMQRKDFEWKEISELSSSSWQTAKEDLAQKNYWPLWSDQANQLQVKFLELTRLAFSLVEPFWDTLDDPGMALTSARKHLYIGASSCHLYWLSHKPWWHPDLVEIGASHLMRCIRSLPVRADLKIEAEILHKQFVTDLWQYHWSGEVEKQYAAYDEVRRELLSRLPVL